MVGHGHGNGHRDVVVLLADVLHNVLALARERCLSHNSGEREKFDGKLEIKCKPVVREALGPVSLNTNLLKNRLRLIQFDFDDSSHIFIVFVLLINCVFSFGGFEEVAKLLNRKPSEPHGLSCYIAAQALCHTCFSTIGMIKSISHFVEKTNIFVECFELFCYETIFTLL